MKNALIGPVTLTFDLSIPKLYHFYGISRSFQTESEWVIKVDAARVKCSY